MKQDPNQKSANNKNIQDSNTAEKIEQFIQQKYNITIPALFFEFLSKENMDFEINDLKSFYSQFGEVVDFSIKGKSSIVLFKTFFGADVCREFLLNENNYKDNMKNNFEIRWFDYDKDKNNLPPEMENIFETIHNHNYCNIKDNNNQKGINMINTNKSKMYNSNNNNVLNNLKQNINNHNSLNINGNSNQNSNNIFMSPTLMMQYNQMAINQGMNINNLNNIQQNIQNMHSLPNFRNMQNIMLSPPPMNMPLFMNQNLGNMNNLMSMQINNHQFNQNKNQFNQNFEEKNYGKYTCKYEILIPNDKDFQVARRLIGSKGCNMKKILNDCKQNNNINNDNIKLRLRGKGSGYKEGPQNKESDEPLHLCISTKNQEEMKKACGLVDDLLNKIYDEYKKYCIKNNISPVAPQLANRIDCGNSLHKVK